MSEPGLRERKRIAAMRRIQDVAYDLFERDGFDAVTIETIAETAEVSPSSVYRYFGTKEQLVLWDEYDPAAFQAFADAVAGHEPLAAMRLAVDAVAATFFKEDRPRIERMVRLAYEVPSIQAVVLQQIQEAGEAIAAIVAGARERDPHELEVQVFASVVVAVVEVGIRHWWQQGFRPDLHEVIDAGLVQVAAGLPLEAAEEPSAPRPSR